MTTARQAAAGRTVFAKIPMGEDEALHVSAETEKGRPVVDIRIFAAFTPARVMMTTRRAVGVDPAILPALIDALRAAQSAFQAAVGA